VRYAGQAVMVVASQLVPSIGSLIALSMGLSLDGDRDVSPITFTLGAVAMAWGLRRWDLFNLTPIGRSTLMSRLTEAVIVLDDQLRVVDANPAAAALLRADEGGLFGQLAAEALAPLPSLTAALRRGLAAGEVEVQEVDGPRWFAATIGGPDRLGVLDDSWGTAAISYRWASR
jgi:PAS domain-containing protein